MKFFYAGSQIRAVQIRARWGMTVDGRCIAREKFLIPSVIIASLFGSDVSCQAENIISQNFWFQLSSEQVPQGFSTQQS